MLSEIKPDVEGQNTAWSHLHEKSKLVRLLEAESRMVPARGCGEGTRGGIGGRAGIFSYRRWIRFRDLPYGIALIVNNSVLHTWKFAKKVDLTLSALTWTNICQAYPAGTGIYSVLSKQLLLVHAEILFTQHCREVEKSCYFSYPLSFCPLQCCPSYSHTEKKSGKNTISQCI